MATPRGVRRGHGRLQPENGPGRGGAHLNWTPDGATTPELLLPAGVYDHPDILRHIVYPLLGERLRMPVFNGFIWRYLFSADILQRENVTFEGAYLEDELFLMEYFCHAQRLAVTEQPLYRYLINPNSATHKYMRDFVQTFQRFMERKSALAERFSLEAACPQWRDFSSPSATSTPRETTNLFAPASRRLRIYAAVRR